MEPQTLDVDGNILGHTHVVIQKLSIGFDDRVQEPPAANEFVFFKGLNQDDSDIAGRLTVAVADGIQETGLFRICTMTASFGHQPVLMPIARRGAQDDCIRVRVVRGRFNPQARKTDEDVTPDELVRNRKRRDNQRRHRRRN